MIGATLFSGIGAPECAMPHWEWPWHAEIEKFPTAVLAARHPKSVNLGDVNAEDFVERAITTGGGRPPDVLVFGSPCQDFSVAGQRVGLDGDRGNLALVALGIADKLRPRWLVFENVPGLLSSRSGSAEAERALRDRGLRGDAGIGDHADAQEDSDFAAFLSLVQQCGYLGCYRVIDAQFAGVPQRRRRVFFVGYLGDWRPAAAVLFEPDSLRGDHPPSRESGKSVAGTISSRPTGGGGFGTDFDLAGGLVESPGAETEIAPPLRSGPTGGKSHGKLNGSDRMPMVVQPPARAFNARAGERLNASSDTFVVTEPIAFKRAQVGKPFDRTDYRPGDAGTVAPYDPECVAFSCKDHGGVAAVEQSPTLRAMEFDGSHANGGGQVAIAFQTRVARNGRGGASEVVPALAGADAGETSDMRPCVAVFKPSHFTRNKDGAPSGVSPPLGAEPDKGDQDPVLFTGSEVRRLTPRECERLQAYEDDYTLIKFRGKPALDGPRYKALGNSMCVNEVRWILTRIEQFESRQA